MPSPSRRTSSPPSRKPITSRDVVSIEGNYLFVGQNNNGDGTRRRFFVRGIGFPTPPPAQTRHYYNETFDVSRAGELELSGWISVLEQLASETDVNAVRLYEMDCRFDYSDFLDRAAELGIYVVVPLTTIMGPGVLSRDEEAPKCYPRKLYEYGKTCLENYWEYPNVVAGVVGNEVMNDLGAWRSAPCVKAYLDDLAAHGRSLVGKGGRSEPMPLVYAAQHDSPSAEQYPDEAIKLTLDYLSCQSKGGGRGEEMAGVLDDSFVMGINIESWCSSLQTFEYEENGEDESSYHALWRTLARGTRVEVTMDAVTGETTVEEVPTISHEPVTVPVLFTEVGCSRKLFNRDNKVQPKLVRDWKQIPVVSEAAEMGGVMSGFVAYGYDGGGNPAFRMMGGAAWDGEHPLPPSPDYDNFREELANVVEGNDVDGADDGRVRLAAKPSSPLKCEEISAKLEELWGVDLYPMADMPSYSSRSTFCLSALGDSGVVALLLKGGNARVISSLHAAPAMSLLAVSFMAAAFVGYRKIDKRGRSTRLTRLGHDSVDYGSCGVE